MPAASPQDYQNILARLAAMDKELAALKTENALLKLELERKDKIIAGLRQRIFGSSSEKIDPAQLQLLFDELIMGKPAPSSGQKWRRIRTGGGKINPHFPALRSDSMALSGASRRKQTPSSQEANS